MLTGTLSSLSSSLSLPLSLFFAPSLYSCLSCYLFSKMIHDYSRCLMLVLALLNQRDAVREDVPGHRQLMFYYLLQWLVNAQRSTQPSQLKKKRLCPAELFVSVCLCLSRCVSFGGTGKKPTLAPRRRNRGQPTGT